MREGEREGEGERVSLLPVTFDFIFRFGILVRLLGISVELILRSQEHNKIDKIPSLFTVLF